MPVLGGIVLSLEKMNRILEIDQENLMAVAQAGVVTKDLQDLVESLGLYYPPDPASRASCTLGGNVAHNAGGPHAVKYGVTRDWILGLEAVLPNGRVIRTGGKLIKNVTGYNLTQLLVGSEGSLAVVTEITVRLIPYPPLRRAVMASFTDLPAAGLAVARLFQRRIVPSACEYMERAVMTAAERRLGTAFPVRRGEAALLVETDGFREDQVEEELAAVGKVFEEQGALEIVAAADAAQANQLWSLRRGLGEAVRRLSAYRELDCSVPRAALPALLRAIRETVSRHGLEALTYGHIGDGNVHVNVLRRQIEEGEWRSRIERATRELFQRVVELGGTLSGEHGIGRLQRNYLPLALSADSIELLRGIKAAFDPQGILNPGKSLPDGGNAS